jgi:hypothetical protein
MKYKLTWQDGTLKEHFKRRKDLVAQYAEQDIEIHFLQSRNADSYEDADWYDFRAKHMFEAKSDEEAIEYAKRFDFGRGLMNGSGVFTLRGIDTRLSWTEEDWNSES